MSIPVPCPIRELNRNRFSTVNGLKTIRLGHGTVMARIRYGTDTLRAYLAVAVKNFTSTRLHSESNLTQNYLEFHCLIRHQIFFGVERFFDGRTMNKQIFKSVLPVFDHKKFQNFCSSKPLAGELQYSPENESVAVLEVVPLDLAFDPLSLNEERTVTYNSGFNSTGQSLLTYDWLVAIVLKDAGVSCGRERIRIVRN